MPNNTEILSQQTECVIWDGDNTIWNWLRYAVPAYEAMCECISKIAGKSVDETAAAMKSFYSAQGTLEAEGLVQALHESGHFANVSDFNLEATIKKAHTVFSKVRRANLHVYEGTQAVIKEIHRRGIRQIMLTDAPVGQAAARVAHSRLGGYFETIYGMPNTQIDLPEGFVAHNQRKGGPNLIVMEDEKPDTDIAVLGIQNEMANRVVMIGDSLSKDMELALKYGWRGIHAEYGHGSGGLVERLQRFAPSRVAARSSSTQNSDSPVSRIISVTNPREILQYIAA